ncbi:CRP-like cAMP-binding protein [Breznakia sp. PF5-3]|uniref:Crp/Fnr family transcriptional regulator n=1 Tax=unclassified Breznakia TaxID=2623764 RepID=UPI00240602A4|nr:MULTISPECIES: Crp/Fnr family transcriptional regulator [unclassified Breznakia]MDF9824647.1 CRP-like cAMP-binding protein [Breznakia sp. PM6-1]MDF9835632.1 CRP-like cAMP-binding protein [Breznakia sp. PF5-3]MDF9837703.1 CRP-like cAMP-binding protein [Breznakia sp. PFB2-8]MDF9859567.1 CRP-like cAMP-binding protein [Breznakia sp. PH5-24]
MNKLFQMLYSHELFSGMRKIEIDDILSKLRKKDYDHETLIYAIGEKQFSIGMVLVGNVSINKIDYWGNRSIIAKLKQGEIFAEAFAFSELDELPVNIVADKNTEVLFISVEQFVFFGVKYPQLMKNMMKILAKKNLYLTKKMDVITKQRIRDKVLSYLSAQAEEHGMYTFTIPLNRNELADFLSVDRSALSNELSKMQKEGILTYHKNVFTLL